MLGRQYGKHMKEPHTQSHICMIMVIDFTAWVVMTHLHVHDADVSLGHPPACNNPLASMLLSILQDEIRGGCSISGDVSAISEQCKGVGEQLGLCSGLLRLSQYRGKFRGRFVHTK